MDKMSAYFLEIINKTITVGITDDLFSASEKAQIIDDYSEWINKNNDEMATGYVICTCYIYELWVVSKSESEIYMYI